MDWAAPNLPRPTPNESSSTETLTDFRFDPRLHHEVSSLASDGIPFNPQIRYLHFTWAQTFFSRPEYFFQPDSISELQKIVTLARRCRRRICVTGFGHSPSDLTCTSSWLVNLDKLSTILEFDVDSKKGLTRFEAGISLHNLNAALAGRGFTLPNLGSIDVQSLAGSISTGTHGSSLNHGLLSQSVTALKVLLSNGQLVSCSATKNTDLFRAALLSLGSLGIIVEMTFQAVPDFRIAWSQTLHPLSSVLSNWDGPLWTTDEYTRVWWLPYLHRAVIWRGSHTEEPARPPNETFYGGLVGYYLYHNLLALSNYYPRILPFVEWFIFGMQYGFSPGSFEMSAVQPAREGLLMNCLYSQFVNEWALPLSKGPEAIVRLSAWINGDEATARIPFSPKGVWVHCPVEVRVSDTSNIRNVSGVRPFLDPTESNSPTLYLNATLYRPYGRDPPCRERYYEAFEWLMRDLGGRPHWAKNFTFTTRDEIGGMYGEEMNKFMSIRDEMDPEGMFLGAWHARNLPLTEKAMEMASTEEEVGTRKIGKAYGDGLLWEGKIKGGNNEGGILMVEEDDDDDVKKDGAGDAKPEENLEGSPTTSQESFDYMARGEASVYVDDHKT